MADIKRGAQLVNIFKDTIAPVTTTDFVFKVTSGTVTTTTLTSYLDSLETKANTTLANLDAHKSNNQNPHSVTKAQVGLSNVDNTSDIDKPISTATQNALNLKANNSALSGVMTDVANLKEAGNIYSVSVTSGSVSLETNRIYSMTISGATTFKLPTPSNTNVFNQIKVMMKVTGTPTINWGTTNFFNKTTPEIEAGSYDVYFDYDKLLGAWVCGVMAKGAAS